MYQVLKTQEKQYMYTLVNKNKSTEFFYLGYYAHGYIVVRTLRNDESMKLTVQLKRNYKSQN